MSLPTIEELEDLTSQCLARTFSDQQVQAIISHSRQLASFGKKSKKDKKKSKKDKKKDKKHKKKDKKDKKKYKEGYKEQPWRPAEWSLSKEASAEGKEYDFDEDETRYVRTRLQEVREKLLHRREASVSNFAPCMLLYTEGSEPDVKETKLDAQCTLLRKASTHALKSEQCWSQYLAKMDECLHHRTGEYCLRAFRPLERQCAQSGWRSVNDLRKLTRLRSKEEVDLQ
ncbi:uncharacterized protein ACA1_234780 [Acanthamoeba castellanii str. Neff]|uniref:Uncharacterized protein n=1 Tax=Acanthamoeba castellanii (strain ATCC 30010 / Neff) TaxID=1257118 RepID=L8H177_ACACF|nr:uncharacterized protein ACA1_234780 [Acanthamoeba castellanii str. Neff]ELR19010.1 hypothetical protein ACA1_234780 [Acanthamoeba castellanii str. Neff]